VSKLLAEGGLPRRAVTPDEMRAIEPTLAGSYYGGYYTESDSTGDIHKFTTAWPGLRARWACSACTVRTWCPASVAARPGRTVTLTVAPRCHRFDAVVVCAGVAQPRLCRAAGRPGQHLPGQGLFHHRDAERRAKPGRRAQVSLLDDETKLVTSRLGADRFRVAGTAEFNGITTRTSAPTASARWSTG
jgi:D-amino-acid dehydrogenase